MRLQIRLQIEQRFPKALRDPLKLSVGTLEKALRDPFKLFKGCVKIKGFFGSLLRLSKGWVSKLGVLGRAHPLESFKGSLKAFWGNP